MEKVNIRERSEMDVFETFTWLIYREVEKHINENPQEYKETLLDGEEVEVA